jgi:hypothetical protein
VLFTIGGAAIVAIFFFGTLRTLDYLNLRYPDSLRAAHAKSLKAALEKYRTANGHYPIYPASRLPVLEKDLVDGGYIQAIPQDPDPKSEVPYSYISDGKIYGMLFHLQFPAGKVQAGGICLTGVGAGSTGWWGQPPECPF